MIAPIRTVFTDLVGTRYPVVQAGMSWVSSCWELPAAVSRAGGLGVLAAGPMRLGDLAEARRQLADRAEGPWAVNVPLYRQGSDEVLALLLESPPPVLIASQGGPRRYLSRFQSAGTICLHVVASLTHARKAAEAGVDGLVVVGGEAGGHPPSGMVSSLVLIRQIAREVPHLPVVAAGGFVDGAGLAAALALGAAAAQFGTRFIASVEARVHPAYQQRVLAANVDDTVAVGRDLGVIRVLRNAFSDSMEELEAAGASRQARSATFQAASLRAAVLDGDVEHGKVEAGQSAGLVRDVAPAAEIVQSIAREFWEVRDRLPERS